MRVMPKCGHKTRTVKVQKIDKVLLTVANCADPLWAWPCFCWQKWWLIGEKTFMALRFEMVDTCWYIIPDGHGRGDEFGGWLLTEGAWDVFLETFSASVTIAPKDRLCFLSMFGLQICWNEAQTGACSESLNRMWFSTKICRSKNERFSSG